VTNHWSEGRGATRREVLALLAAVGAGMVLAPGDSIAQTAPKWSGIIDTHHHIYPRNFTAKNLARIIADGSPYAAGLYAPWTPHFSLEQMDQNGVATAIVSISSPGVWYGNNEEGRKWARECNEFGAQMIKDYPGRFGMFAAIPLPDTEGSLREIEYAYDVLKLDGIGLLTSYDKGKLLGHASFAPVFDELNRRKAVVFVHPTISCCGNTDPLVNGPPIDFPTDTTRAITSLVYSGTLVRCPDIRFIFSHGGGTTMMLISRLAGNSLKPEERAKLIPNGFEGELRKFYYDIASVAVNPAAMAAVFKVIPKNHIVFGSDIPFWKIETIATAMSKLEVSPGELRGIQRENALQLFPRLKA
jgi:predicted TIM-barrel fold metal-dependent hydrolase